MATWYVCSGVWIDGWWGVGLVQGFGQSVFYVACNWVWERPVAADWPRGSEVGLVLFLP